uniref:N-acetyltransferase domain-containing protein n=1 Tax=Cacopsylla melanoneura TaxID=428564 RepID=A0A8D8UY42_9HEMI
MDIKIEPVTKSDEPRVIKFLKEQFYANEPLNVAIQERFKSIPSNLEGETKYANCVHDNLTNGLCLKAVDGEGHIVGAVINTCPINGMKVSRVEIQGRQEMMKVSRVEIQGRQDMMKEIIKFLHHIDELSGEAQFLAKHASNVMDIKILSVHRDHQKKSIGSRLIEESIKAAESKNIKAITIGCSSAYTSAIIQHKFPHFRRVLTYPISEYTDSVGDVMFKVQDPHKEYHVYFYET